MEMMIAKKGCDTDFLPASHRGISKKAAFCIHSPMFIVYCERFFLLCFYVCLFVCFCCSVFLFQVWQKCIVCFLKISAFVANVSFPEVFVHISSMFYKRKIIVACCVVKWKKRPNLDRCLLWRSKSFNKREKVSFINTNYPKIKITLKENFARKLDLIHCWQNEFFFEKWQLQLMMK